MTRWRLLPGIELLLLLCVFLLHLLRLLLMLLLHLLIALRHGLLLLIALRRRLLLRSFLVFLAPAAALASHDLSAVERQASAAVSHTSGPVLHSRCSEAGAG